MSRWQHDRRALQSRYRWSLELLGRAHSPLTLALQESLIDVSWVVGVVENGRGGERKKIMLALCRSLTCFLSNPIFPCQVQMYKRQIIALLDESCYNALLLVWMSLLGGGGGG